MSRYSLIFLSFVLGLSGPSLGAEVGKSNQIDSLTSFQLGDYSVKFDGEGPRKPNDLFDPPGLQSFRKDAFNPFVDLKLSSPLKDKFLEREGEMEGTGSTGGIENQ
jgi:hypothetical protein